MNNNMKKIKEILKEILFKAGFIFLVVVFIGLCAIYIAVSLKETLIALAIIVVIIIILVLLDRK